MATRPVKILEEMRAADEPRARYNGGWSKKVTGLDKSKANGYSILGDFVHSPAILAPGDLVLDCDINGSRKNQVKDYVLARVTETGLEVLAREDDSREWAINLWPAIEAAIAAKAAPVAPAPETPAIDLSAVPTEALVAELLRREAPECAECVQFRALMGTDAQRATAARKRTDGTLVCLCDQHAQSHDRLIATGRPDEPEVAA